MTTGAADEHRERELKFDVPADWRLPDPARLVPAGGSVTRQTVRMETTYFDTARQDLLRHRLTLRRRTGDVDAGWQLKVPAGDARTEIRLPLGGRGVPAELRDATLGVRGGAALAPLATLVTEREIHRLLDADGSAQVEIVVDAVTAVRAGAAEAARRWHEVEAELVEGDEKLLGRVARWLSKQGASPSPSSSKLARAVDVETGGRPDAASLSGLVAAYLDEQANAIVTGDIALRRDHDTIHATRVGTRRYRSVLRTLGGVFDPARAAALDAELAWFASALGAVRDRHVLRRHLAGALADLPPELTMGPVAERIAATLADEEQDALARLAAVMRSKRYFALLGELRAWREQLPLASDEPAEHVADYLAKAQRKVTRRLDAAPPGPGRSEALHRARKAAKRARYLAELGEPQLGKASRTVEKRLKKLQGRLGLRQDCVVAAEFLRRLGAAAGSTGENGFTYGVLYERELAKVRAIDG
jgi:CHAD domain-containing protein